MPRPTEGQSGGSVLAGGGASRKVGARRAGGVAPYGWKDRFSVGSAFRKVEARTAGDGGPYGVGITWFRIVGAGSGRRLAAAPNPPEGVKGKGTRQSGGSVS